MRQRKKQSATATAVQEVERLEQTDGWPKAGFVPIDHPPMVVLAPHALDHVDVLDGIDVNGAYVKYAPVVRASEKLKFSAGAARAHYMHAGAVAVVVTPKVVPDAADVEKTKPTAQLSPEGHLRDWLDGVKGATSRFAGSALDEALATISEVGL